MSASLFQLLRQLSPQLFRDPQINFFAGMELFSGNPLCGRPAGHKPTYPSQDRKTQIPALKLTFLTDLSDLCLSCTGMFAALVFEDAALLASLLLLLKLLLST